MNIVYLLADTLQMPLHEVQDGRVRGCTKKVLRVGPWSIDTDVVACSDEYTNTRMSLVVRIKGDVWVYVTCQAGGGMVSFLFNGKGMKSKDVAKIGCGSISSTLAKIQPSIVAAFEFKMDKKKWSSVDVSGAVEQVLGA